MSISAISGVLPTSPKASQSKADTPAPTTMPAFRQHLDAQAIQPAATHGHHHHGAGSPSASASAVSASGQAASGAGSSGPFMSAILKLLP